MPRNLGLIIFLLFIVWQVVSAIINQINANKQQQRSEELARQRRQTTGGASTAEESKPSRRVDDLAARRKAQLEELRQRREAESGQNRSTVQTRVGGTSGGMSPTIKSAPTSPQTESPKRRREQDPWQARQDAIKRQRNEELTRKAEQARASQIGAAQQRAYREQAAAEADARRRARQAEQKSIEAGETPPAVEGDSIRRMMHRRATLREMFVMKELLDQPVSLRESSVPEQV